MIRTEVPTYDLADAGPVHITRGSDVVFLADFSKDMTGATHELVIDEPEYDYAPFAFESLADVSRTTFDDADASNGIIRHAIAAATLDAWADKRLRVTWKVTLDGDTWVALTKIFTVGP